MLHRSRTTPRTSGGRRYNTDKLLAEIVHAYIALYDRGQYRGKTKAKKTKAKHNNTKPYSTQDIFLLVYGTSKSLEKKYMWFNWERCSQICIINSFRFDI